MGLEIARRIADPVHGSIGLTELECRIIDTPVFQRLREVKHLGLAHQVYPSADFSRFSHSIGVCHVVGQLLTSLAQNTPDLRIDDRQWQLCRLAGLLHDIGHYPISHALEGPIEDYYSGRQAASAFKSNDGAKYSTWLKHERVGALILEEDRRIRSLLESCDHNYAPDEVSDLFMRRTKQGKSAIGRVDPFAALVSSDLDADRIDYLQRTALHTGIPYGNVDFGYLLSQIVIDEQGFICLNERALRTADHFLLARYFDAQQVAFHKTVAGLEAILKDCVFEMLKEGLLELDRDQLTVWLKDEVWSTKDDHWLVEQLTLARESSKIGATTKLKIDAVLQRRPPKLVWGWEEIVATPDSALGAGGEAGPVERYKKKATTAEEAITKAAQIFGVDIKRFKIWEQRPFRLTRVELRDKYGLLEEADQSYGLTLDERERAENDLDQIIRIKLKNEPNGRWISNIRSSLMSVLDRQALSAVRIYFVTDPASEIEIETLRHYFAKL